MSTALNTSSWLLPWFWGAVPSCKIEGTFAQQSRVVADSQAESFGTGVVTDMPDSMTADGENDGPASANGATSKLAGLGVNKASDGILTENFRPKLSAVPELTESIIKPGACFRSLSLVFKVVRLFIMWENQDVYRSMSIALPKDRFSGMVSMFTLCSRCKCREARQAQETIPPHPFERATCEEKHAQSMLTDDFVKPDNVSKAKLACLVAACKNFCFRRHNSSHQCCSPVLMLSLVRCSFGSC